LYNAFADLIFVIKSKVSFEVKREKKFYRSFDSKLLKYSLTAGAVLTVQGNINASVDTRVVNKTFTSLADNYVVYSINMNPEEDSIDDLKFSFY